MKAESEHSINSEFKQSAGAGGQVMAETTIYTACGFAATLTDLAALGMTSDVAYTHFPVVKR